MGFVSFKKILPIQEVSPVLFKTIEQAKEFILDNEIEMVDFKMTDIDGRWRHITIPAARTRFGSCSGKNRLSFSLYLMAYPETAIEYVGVHELAHIRHHDHSPAFYREVEAYLPDWRARRALLRR